MELDEQWKKQRERLVELKRQNGHCTVPFRYEHDKTLGGWVSRQRHFHTSNKMRNDRKALLDEIGFLWNGNLIIAQLSTDDKKWNMQYEKLVAFKREHEHCRVPLKCKEDVSLGTWVGVQRKRYTSNKMRLDRQVLLDELGSFWKAHTLAGWRSAPTDDVSVLVIGSFHASDRSFAFLTILLVMLALCRILIRKRSPAVGVSQTKQQKRRNQRKVPL